MYPPPDTLRVSPVMERLASVARNRTALAMSSGVVTRLSGISLAILVISSAGTMVLRKGFGTIPGATALTRTPWDATWPATDRVRPRTAAFEAWYAVLPMTWLVHASVEAMLTMDPPPR